MQDLTCVFGVSISISMSRHHHALSRRGKNCPGGSVYIPGASPRVTMGGTEKITKSWAFFSPSHPLCSSLRPLLCSYLQPLPSRNPSEHWILYLSKSLFGLEVLLSSTPPTSLSWGSKQIMHVLFSLLSSALPIFPFSLVTAPPPS